jgi:hypothetical protein
MKAAVVTHVYCSVWVDDTDAHAGTSFSNTYDGKHTHMYTPASHNPHTVYSLTTCTNAMSSARAGNIPPLTHFEQALVAIRHTESTSESRCMAAYTMHTVDTNTTNHVIRAVFRLLDPHTYDLLSLSWGGMSVCWHWNKLPSRMDMATVSLMPTGMEPDRRFTARFREALLSFTLKRGERVPDRRLLDRSNCWSTRCDCW